MSDQISLECKFLNMFVIVKDVGSIRAKGVWVEKIEDFITGGSATTRVDSKRHECAGQSFIEAIETINEYGLYSFGGSAGLPTLKVGCKSKAAWIKLRDQLREAGLVRLK
jgi:hypothetical protein